MKMTSRQLALVMVAGFAFIPMAMAAPSFVSGYDGSANKIVDPTKSPFIARTAFESGLSGTIMREDFESFAVPGVIPASPTPDVVFSFGKISGNAIFPSNQAVSGSATGNFNTTSGGSKFIDASNVVTIAFDQAVSAFGLYFTDLGDFTNSAITATLTRSDGVKINTDLKTGGTDADLLFWGFTESDPNVFYSSITFNTSNTLDVFGMDDFVSGIRDQGASVPEPGSLPVVAAALLALGVARRRRA